MKHSKHAASALVLAAFVALAAGSGDGKKDRTTTRSNLRGDSATAAAPASKAEYMTRIDRELASIRSFNGEQYRQSKDAVMLGTALFGAWAKQIHDAQQYQLDAGEKAKVAQLRERVSAIQTREFPKLRAAYAGFIGQAMWEHDVEVKSGGTANRTLRLTAGMFASNGNIKQAQETIYEQAMLLRFKRTEFRWYEDADDYTYYSLESPADGAIRQLTEQGWAAAD